jgi:hypothetical protein
MPDLDGIQDLKPFKSLAEIKESYALSWIGALHPNLDDESSPLLECIFSPLNSQLAEDYDTQLKIGIAIGFLPTLSIGQIYKNGMLTDEHLSKETLLIRIDTRKQTTINETSLSKMEDRFMKLRKEYFHAARSGLKCVEGVKVDPNSQNPLTDIYDNSISILIPEIELIRFYYAKSEDLSKALVSNAFEGEQLPIKIFNSIHEGPTFEIKTKLARFVYRHHFDRNDAIFLARIIFSNSALAGARRINKSIVQQRVNNAPTLETYPRTNFPFYGESTLKVRGKWEPTKNGRKFLVHRILSCTGSFPFKGLSCCNELERGANPDNKEVIESTGNNFPSFSSSTDENRGYSVSDAKPRATLNPDHIEFSSGEFEGLRDIKIEYEKLRDNTHKFESRRPSRIDGLHDVSTGDTTSGDSSAKKININDTATPTPMLGADLAPFISAIDLLIKKQDKKPAELKLKISYIGANNSYYDSALNIEVSVFPTVFCPERHSVKRKFSFIDDKKKKKRKFLCVEFCAQHNSGNLYLYLFHAERRIRPEKEMTPLQKQNNDIYMEELPILMLHKKHYEQCIAVDFKDMLRLTVTSKNWPNESEISFIKQTIEHTNSPDKLCNLIEDRVKKYFRSLQR